MRALAERREGRAVLGWEAQIGVREGVAQTVDWLRTRVSEWGMTLAGPSKSITVEPVELPRPLPLPEPEPAKAPAPRPASPTPA